MTANRPIPGKHYQTTGDIIERFASNTITRLANTTAYSALDAVSDHATAGSASDFEFDTVRRAGMITRVELKASHTATRATMRVHLYSSAPTIAGGDNAAFSATIDSLVATVDLELDQVGTDGVIGYATTAIPYQLTAESGKLYALLQTVDGFTPISAETFDIALLVVPGA